MPFRHLDIPKKIYISGLRKNNELALIMAFASEDPKVDELPSMFKTEILRRAYIY